MKKNILFISCEEAQHICDKNQYGEASFWEKFKLGLRLSWCRITRAYSKNNNALSKCIEDSKVNVLSKDELDDMKQKFEKQLGNQN